MTSTTPGRTGKRSNRPVRIGNASGFYGDRFSAMREMLEGGELDYLTGDYLAELTMLILGRDQLKDCLLYTSPSPRDKRQSRMPSSA